MTPYIFSHLIVILIGIFISWHDANGIPFWNNFWMWPIRFKNIYFFLVPSQTKIINFSSRNFCFWRFKSPIIKSVVRPGILKNQVIKNWPMRETHLKHEYSTLNDRADHLLLLNWYLHMLVLIKSLIQAVKIAAKILPILELFSTIDSFSNPKLEIDISMWLVVTLLHN